MDLGTSEVIVMFRNALRQLPLILLLIVPATNGQLLDRPTPMPTATADNEPWFVDRIPLLFGGNLYFPAGPRVHFNQNEMVRTGIYGSIPLYVRTTLEPRSVIFVPLSGGLMQPYERRRSGELAGTEGSYAPSFPVQNPAEQTGRVEPLRAPGPPIGFSSPVSSMMGDTRPVTGDDISVAAPAHENLAATTGTFPGGRVRIGGKPEGLNNVFIDYGNERWFNSGPAVPLDLTSLQKIGTYHGLAVYASTSRPATIYVPVSRDVTSLVVPYSIARGR